MVNPFKSKQIVAMEQTVKEAAASQQKPKTSHTGAPFKSTPPASITKKTSTPFKSSSSSSTKKSSSSSGGSSRPPSSVTKPDVSVSYVGQDKTNTVTIPTDAISKTGNVVIEQKEQMQPESIVSDIIVEKKQQRSIQPTTNVPAYAAEEQQAAKQIGFTQKDIQLSKAAGLVAKRIHEYDVYSKEREAIQRRMKAGGPEGVLELTRFVSSSFINFDSFLATTWETVAGGEKGPEKILDMYTMRTVGLDRITRDYGVQGVFLESYKPGGFGFFVTSAALMPGLPVGKVAQKIYPTVYKYTPKVLKTYLSSSSPKSIQNILGRYSFSKASKIYARDLGYFGTDLYETAVKTGAAKDVGRYLASEVTSFFTKPYAGPVTAGWWKNPSTIEIMPHKIQTATRIWTVEGESGMKFISTALDKSRYTIGDIKPLPGQKSFVSGKTYYKYYEASEGPLGTIPSIREKVFHGITSFEEVPLSKQFSSNWVATKSIGSYKITPKTTTKALVVYDPKNIYSFQGRLLRETDVVENIGFSRSLDTTSGVPGKYGFTTVDKPKIDIGFGMSKQYGAAYSGSTDVSLTFLDLGEKTKPSLFSSGSGGTTVLEPTSKLSDFALPGGIGTSMKSTIFPKWSAKAIHPSFTKGFSVYNMAYGDVSLSQLMFLEEGMFMGAHSIFGRKTITRPRQDNILGFKTNTKIDTIIDTGLKHDTVIKSINVSDVVGDMSSDAAMTTQDVTSSLKTTQIDLVTPVTVVDTLPGQTATQSQTSTSLLKQVPVKLFQPVMSGTGMSYTPPAPAIDIISTPPGMLFDFEEPELFDIIPLGKKRYGRGAGARKRTHPVELLFKDVLKVK